MVTAYSSEYLQTHASEVRKLFFEAHLIFNIKTKLSLQKRHIKNESCKSYLGNREQKAIFLVVPQSDVHFSFERLFFCVPNGVRK